MSNLAELIHNNESDLEKQVLSDIIVSKQIHPDIKPEYFTGSRYKCFLAIWDQWNKNSDIDIEVIPKDHFGVISDCMDCNGTQSDLAIDKLKQSWITREYAKTIISSHINDPEKDVSLVQEKLSEILISKQKKDYIHSEAISNLVKELDDICSRKNNISGTPTGLKKIDQTINGFEKGKFYVLGGLKKHGKSRFMVFLATKLKNSYLNSLEMNEMQLNKLALSHFSQIDERKLSGRLSSECSQSLCKAYTTLNCLNWYITKRYSVSELKTHLLYLMRKRQIDFVFVDFIQRMRNPIYKTDRVREVESISQGLADLSRDLNVGVIALSQLGGTAERLKDGEIPNMSYLKESQAIAENADCIIIFHNESRSENPFDDYGNYTVPEISIGIEQRYGLSGSKIKILGDLRTCTFTDIKDG